MRPHRLTIPFVLLIALVIAGLGSSGRFANAALQDATPAATDATPSATAATPVVAGEASPIAEPGTPAVEPVTLVFTYRPDAAGNFLVLVPVEVEGLVLTTGEPEGDVETQVDFESPRNDNLPWIRYGNDVFEAYLPLDDPGLVTRWVYLDEDPEARPSTLVLQVVCVRGDYADYTGTATFVSRGGDLGGTLILALDPPTDE